MNLVQFVLPIRFHQDSIAPSHIGSQVSGESEAERTMMMMEIMLFRIIGLNNFATQKMKKKRKLGENFLLLFF
jgi:hypothetical protein